MSALELIKSGIINQNWASVVEAYKLLSGEDLSKPKEKPEPKKRGRKPKEKLQIILPTEEDMIVVHEEVEKDPFAKFRFTPGDRKQTLEANKIENGKIYAKKEPLIIGPRKNKFEEIIKKNKNLEKDSEQNQKYFASLTPSPRREEVQFGKKTCVKCKTVVEIPLDMMSHYGDGSADSELPSFLCDYCL